MSHIECEKETFLLSKPAKCIYILVEAMYIKVERNVCLLFNGRQYARHIVWTMFMNSVHACSIVSTVVNGRLVA
jgi:hypothetical protein